MSLNFLSRKIHNFPPCLMSHLQQTAQQKKNARLHDSVFLRHIFANRSSIIREMFHSSYENKEGEWNLFVVVLVPLSWILLRLSSSLFPVFFATVFPISPAYMCQRTDKNRAHKNKLKVRNLLEVSLSFG